MKSKKIIGWLLVGLGLLIVLWALYSSYNIFTGKNQAPQVFKTQESAVTSSTMPEDIEGMVQEQLKNVIPAEFISNLFNLITWSVLAAILIFGGSRISGIGINLLRKS